MELTEKFNDGINSITKYINKNIYLDAFITIFLAVYAGALVQDLPEKILKIFDNTLMKIFMFFLIAMTAKVSPHIAILAAFAFFLTIRSFEKLKLAKDNLQNSSH